jgi:hypothetical protein
VRLSNYNTLNSSFGRVVTVLAAAYLLSKILKSVLYLISELQFYRGHDWDFEQDSKIPCWMQNELVRYLGYVPIRIMKLAVETTWIALRLLLISFLIYGAFYA